jgi:hypothetical protein
MRTTSRRSRTMANYYSHYSVMFNPGPENITQALSLAAEMREDPEKFGLDYFNVEIEEQDGELWLNDDASNDTEGAISFVKECAKLFNLKGLWGFQYCNWCDKPRLDGYGGGVVVVNLETGEVQWMDTGNVLGAWMDGEKADV